MSTRGGFGSPTTKCDVVETLMSVSMPAVDGPVGRVDAVRRRRFFQRRLPAIQALGRDERPGILEADRERVGAARDLQHLGQFRVQRAARRRERQVARPSGGVYIGVGPEQNFSYIARLRPAMAFIIDIRRENLNLHLFYKALFEVSSDRADFVSRLFSRPRPTGIWDRRRASRRSSRAIGASRLRASCSAGTRRRCSTSGCSRPTVFPLSQTDLDVDRSRVRGLLRRRAGDPVLGLARGGRAPALVPAADDHPGTSPARAAASSRARKSSGSSRRCSRGT